MSVRYNVRACVLPVGNSFKKITRSYEVRRLRTRPRRVHNALLNVLEPVSNFVTYSTFYLKKK
jgi:hypothetical protein